MRTHFAPVLLLLFYWAAACTRHSASTQREEERISDYASLAARVIQTEQIAQTNRYFLLLSTQIPDLRVIYCVEGAGSQSLSQMEASSDMEYQFHFNRPLTADEHHRLAGCLPWPKALSAGLLHLTGSAGRWQESMKIIPYNPAGDRSVLSVRLNGRMDIVAAPGNSQ